MIDQAIEEAERNTSGEIVVAVASASGRYDRAEDLFGLTLALIGLTALWCLQPQISSLFSVESGWSTGELSPQILVIQLMTVLALFNAGTWAAARWTVLRAPFVRNAEMQQDVDRRALEVFQQQRLRATTGTTGVLIYISLFERRVRVVGDDAISRKLTPADWQSICDRIIEGMNRKTPTQGLRGGIELAGELLARHFPRAADDQNELPNRLVLID